MPFSKFIKESLKLLPDPDKTKRYFSGLLEAIDWHQTYHTDEPFIMHRSYIDCMLTEKHLVESEA